MARIVGKVFRGDALPTLVVALRLPTTTLGHREQALVQRHEQVTMMRATECVLFSSFCRELSGNVESGPLVVRYEEDHVVDSERRRVRLMFLFEKVQARFHIPNQFVGNRHAAVSDQRRRDDRRIHAQGAGGVVVRVPCKASCFCPDAFIQTVRLRHLGVVREDAAAQ